MEVQKYRYHENMNKKRIALADGQQRGFLVHYRNFYKKKKTTTNTEMDQPHGGPYQSEESLTNMPHSMLY